MGPKQNIDENVLYYKRYLKLYILIRLDAVYSRSFQFSITRGFSSFICSPVVNGTQWPHIFQKSYTVIWVLSKKHLEILDQIKLSLFSGNSLYAKKLKRFSSFICSPIVNGTQWPNMAAGRYEKIWRKDFTNHCKTSTYNRAVTKVKRALILQV